MKKRFFTVIMSILMLGMLVIFVNQKNNTTKAEGAEPSLKTTQESSSTIATTKYETKKLNTTIQAAQEEFKTKADFDNWIDKTTVGKGYDDNTKIIAVPEDDGHGWVTGASDATGPAGTVTDMSGKVLAEYSFDDKRQTTTIGEIRASLPD
jgi:hypothetical protein